MELQKKERELEEKVVLKPLAMLSVSAGYHDKAILAKS